MISRKYTDAYQKEFSNTMIEVPAMDLEFKNLEVWIDEEHRYNIFSSKVDRF